MLLLQLLLRTQQQQLHCSQTLLLLLLLCCYSSPPHHPQHHQSLRLQTGDCRLTCYSLFGFSAICAQQLLLCCFCYCQLLREPQHGKQRGCVLGGVKQCWDIKLELQLRPASNSENNRMTCYELLQ
jgi:hypothetical protein